MEWSREIQDALAAPFPEDEIEFLPRASASGRALALAHIDARSVMRRLDAVVGAENWSFDYEAVSPDGKRIKGSLTVLGVTKCDAGEAAAEDEPLKAAVSDAIKRCAVHFGIARYLYYLPQLWVPYDAAKRRFTETPRLPAGALERALAVCGYRGALPASTAPARPAARPPAQPPAPRSQGPRPAEAEKPASAPAPAPAPPAADNGELLDRLTDVYTRARGFQGDTVMLADLCAILDASAGSVRELNAGQAIKAINVLQAEIEARRAAMNPATGEVAPSPGMTCASAGCGKELTKGQHDVSMRAFGQPFCPACQRQQARSA